MKRLNNIDPSVLHMMAILLLLVKRNGGQMTVEDLSELAGTASYLSLELDTENDRATLTVMTQQPARTPTKWRLN